MSAPRAVVVVPTGTANLASVLAVFRRLDTSARVAETAADVESAERLVVPGVGSFGVAMRRLAAAGFVDAVRAHVTAGRPTLGFCVGHQILFETSDENPGVPGLGVVPGHVGRFPETVRIPQFGWNRIEPAPGCRFLEPGFFYFANSFRVAEPPEGCHPAFADHGGRYLAAFEQGPMLGCQFHPELSAQAGQALLRRWLERA